MTAAETGYRYYKHIQTVVSPLTFVVGLYCARVVRGIPRQMESHEHAICDLGRDKHQLKYCFMDLALTL